MDHKEKADNSLSGKSVADLMGEVFGLEQAEARESLNDLMKVFKRIDAHCRKNGKPTDNEKAFRNLKKNFEEEKREMEQKNKIVSWKIIRNISNALTNQLYLGDGVDITQAHMSLWQDGPIREYTMATGHGKGGIWREAIGCGGQGWNAFNEEEVTRLYWESMSSGSGLEARKIRPDLWQLKFIPSTRDPEYRGQYYRIWSAPEAVKNVDEAYMKQA